MKNSLIPFIRTIELYCQKQNINHRFVGGVSFGGLLNEQTIYDIDIKQKIIRLKRHNRLSLLRPDKTIKDIDIICFCADEKKLKKLKDYITRVKKKDPKFPHVSIENAIYVKLQKRIKVVQFVTTFEVDNKNNLFLTFDTLFQQVPWESVESWKVVLEDKITYNVRNPIADYYAYQFRSPAGVKPKDEKKLKYLKKLVDNIIEKGKKGAIDYNGQDYFASWHNFISKLQNSSSIRIRFKQFILKLYWSTLGTSLAHGKGLSGKYLLPLSNKFTGKIS